MADDLKLIKGIGPVIEQRLHDAGVSTYSGLAALSAEEIAALVTNLSAQQITKQGWIPQARKLASGKSRSRSRQKEQTVQKGRQHYENFTFEFLLDEKNKSRRLRVVHVQSGDVDTWANWDAERLIGFLARHIGSHLPIGNSAIPNPIQPGLRSSQSRLSESSTKALTEKTITPSVSGVLKETSVPLASFASITAPQIPASTDHTTSEIVHEQGYSPYLGTSSINKIRLLEWKLLLGNTDHPWSNIPQDQPFDIRLTLDLNNVALADESSLEINGTLYLKKLGSGQRQMLCETHGIVPYAGILNLTIGKARLPAGNYHLEALVTLKHIGSEAKRQPGIMAFLEVGIVQVY